MPATNQAKVSGLISFALPNEPMTHSVWERDWPPPQVLAVAKIIHDEYYVDPKYVVTPAEEWSLEAIVPGTCAIYFYDRISCSTMPDPMDLIGTEPVAVLRAAVYHRRGELPRVP